MLAVGRLMEAIYAIGTTHSATVPDRLFAHQFGDGFVIVSDFSEESAERPLGIAIALLRHLISSRVACKAAISCGGFSDVFGCYPERVRDAADDHHRVRLGEGLMTINPVMGTALNASYELAGKCRGSVLLIKDKCFADIPVELVVSSRNPTVVDWVHTEIDTAREISETAGLSYPTGTRLESLLHEYVEGGSAGASTTWVTSTLSANGLSVA